MVKNKVISISRIERIGKMRSDGLSYDEIGLKLGMSREWIRKVHQKGNITKSKTPKLHPWLKTGEVARLVNVHVSTVRRWANAGVIKSYRVGPRSDRRFSREDVNLLFNESSK